MFKYGPYRPLEAPLFSLSHVMVPDLKTMSKRGSEVSALIGLARQEKDGGTGKQLVGDRGQALAAAMAEAMAEQGVQVDGGFTARLGYLATLGWTLGTMGRMDKRHRGHEDQVHPLWWTALAMLSAQTSWGDPVLQSVMEWALAGGHFLGRTYSGQDDLDDLIESFGQDLEAALQTEPSAY